MNNNNIYDDSFKTDSSSYFEVKIVNDEIIFDGKFKDESEKLALLSYIEIFLDKKEQEVKNKMKKLIP